MGTMTFAAMIEGLYNKALDQIAFDGIAPDCSALAATLTISIAGQSRTPLHALGEEAATAGLVARMAANFTFCAAGLKDTNTLPALWGHYSKSGTNEDSESCSGADFALVIPVGTTRCRVAIVQAKRPSGGTVPLFHAGTATHPKSQMQKLVALRATWMKELRIQCERGDDWIHYLLWTTGVPRTITLTKAASGSVTTGKGDNVVVAGRPSFATLALAVCSPEAFGKGNVVRNGWLELDMKDAAARLPELLPIIDVVLADEEGGGAGLAAALTQAWQAQTQKSTETPTQEIAGVGEVSLESVKVLKP